MIIKDNSCFIYKYGAYVKRKISNRIWRAVFESELKTIIANFVKWLYVWLLRSGAAIHYIYWPEITFEYKLMNKVRLLWRP